MARMKQITTPTGDRPTKPSGSPKRAALAADRMESAGNRGTPYNKDPKVSRPAYSAQTGRVKTFRKRSGASPSGGATIPSSQRSRQKK